LTLYLLKASPSGFIKIGRSSNFDKRLSEIRRATTDIDVEVVAVYHADADTVIARERQLHIDLSGSNFKGEWFYDTPEVRGAWLDVDREFNPENYSVSA
jgi:hypothetical protein